MTTPARKGKEAPVEDAERAKFLALVNQHRASNVRLETAFATVLDLAVALRNIQGELAAMLAANARMREGLERILSLPGADMAAKIEAKEALKP